MVQFDDREKAISYLQGNVAGAGLAEACVDEFRHPKRILLATFARYSWIIRDEDLKAWDAFLTMLAVGAGTSSLLGFAQAGIPAVFALFMRARQKGAYLRTDQYLVLSHLKRFNAPTTTAELASSVDLPEADVRNLLKELEQVRCHDGTMICAVSEVDGRWMSAGI